MIKIGMISRISGDVHESFELLKKCHIHNDLNLEFLRQLSRTLYLLGKPKSAIEVASEAMKFDAYDWVYKYSVRFNL
jgi:Bardet-Biedl syndrome 4 protein